MTTTNVAKWYCCLNPAENAAVQVCAANAGPVTYFVLKTLVDAAFLLAYEGSSSIRETIFIENWGLTEGTIPPDDPEGIQVFYLDVGIWDDINVFLTEHGTGCDDECKIRTFPD